MFIDIEHLCRNAGIICGICRYDRMEKVLCQEEGVVVILNLEQIMTYSIMSKLPASSEGV